MKISMNWINDFVDLPESDAQALSNRFTLGAAEVEEVSREGEYLEQIFVAEVESVKPHPDASKLNLVSFKYGGDKQGQVVCGADNVTIGMKTPFAPVGVTLPIGLTLEPKKIRGVLSEGMLCSEEELGLVEKSSGIMELDSQAPVGLTLADYWEQKSDVIIDIDNKSLTHRPDMWGHYGIAREFAALYQASLKRPYSQEWANSIKKKITKTSAPLKVKVESGSSCLAYFGISLNGVEVKDSPRWIQSRLILAGLRPINNIVDISNYVMLELGHPLHIFDRDKIQGDQIVIKSLDQEISFETLDEQSRKLLKGDTVICDRENPLVLAGVMGGLNSGVDEQTKNIFIEVANWKASDVRRVSTRLGLRTDSSQRFEKSLDSLQCEQTLLRTVELILDQCPQAEICGDIVFDGDEVSAKQPLSIHVQSTKISQVLGKEIDENEVVAILERLEFQVERDQGNLKVTVPSFRATKDIECEADIIEEIGRVIGYDNITAASPLLEISPVRLTPKQSLHRSVRDFLVYHTRSYELMTYPLIGRSLLKKASWSQDDVLEIQNALSHDAEIMRPSLIPNFLQTCSLNAKNFSEFRFFELGRSYHSSKKSETFAREKSLLGLCYYSRDESVFMDVVNDTERLIEAVNLPAQLVGAQSKFVNEVVDHDWLGLHPFERYDIRVMGKMKGSIFSVHPLVLRDFKIKGSLAMSFIDITEHESRELKDSINYKPLAKFPSSSFDWTVVADKNIPVEDILKSSKKVKIKTLKDVSIVDVYERQEDKTVTLRATFLDESQTLSGDFLSDARDQLVIQLEKDSFLLKRD